jgi:nucleoside-diphosphate-sugar epimerase
MTQAGSNFRWREAVPRMLADFAIVHISMIAALTVSVVYQAGVGNGTAAQALVSGFSRYYTAFFWLLSPIFPLVYLLNGFYTGSGGYSGRHRTLVILRGVTLAAGTYFAANYLVSGSEMVGRSVALPFAVFAAAGATAARLVKSYVQDRYLFRSKEGSAARLPDRVLVVGGAGYIGSLLAERLLEKGYRVRVFDSLVYGDEALRPVKGHPGFELFVGDCRNIQDVVKAVSGVESIIHLAAIVGDPACNQERESALQTNYAATRMLIEIAKGNGVSRFVFASSCSVYGAADAEMDENSPTRPISLYGQTKVDSERALLEAKSDTFHPIVLRYATVFGLGYRPRFDLVVNLLTAKAHQEGVITIYNGQQWRPFIHVRDLTEATIQALEAPVRLTSGQIFNVGDKRLNYTLAGIADIIKDAFPDVRVEQVDNSDRRDYRVNFDKISSRIGFSARYTVRDGVNEIRRAFEAGLIVDYKDLRYNNQQYLMAIGTPANKDEVDALVMAAFSAKRVIKASAA